MQRTHLSPLNSQFWQVLDDALVREDLREQVALYVENHNNLFTDFQDWAKTKLEYLGVKETCTNSLEARTALNVLDQFETHKAAKESGDVAALNKLGDTIRAAKHKTEYSEWVYEKPSDVTDLETKTTKLVADLAAAAAAKREILDDDLAREVRIQPADCRPYSENLSIRIHHSCTPRRHDLLLVATLTKVFSVGNGQPKKRLSCSPIL